MPHLSTWTVIVGPPDFDFPSRRLFVKKTTLTTVAAVSALALTIGGCAQPPSATPAPGGASGGAADGAFTACMVSDAGGFNDKSFNETAYNGLIRARDELKIETKQIESNAEGEFAGNVQSMVSAKCSIIITVGFALANATKAAAQQNPNVKFAIVDNESFAGVNNVKGLIFNAAQPSFMAGYLAAAMSKTGTVGTFGGAKYPTVTVFMDGFVQGVDYYNKQKGKQVKAIGWDAQAQNGQFVGGNNPFGDLTGGKNTATTLLSQGADIILPVAGPSGLGAMQAIRESNGKANAIWVDTDGYKSAPDFKDLFISSAEKTMDLAVFEAIKAAKEGSFSSDPYIGTLANDGAKLAPFHDFDSKVPAEVKSELETIKKHIIDGTIKIDSPSQPKK